MLLKKHYHGWTLKAEDQYIYPTVQPYNILLHRLFHETELNTGKLFANSNSCQTLIHNFVQLLSLICYSTFFLRNQANLIIIVKHTQSKKKRPF